MILPSCRKLIVHAYKRQIKQFCYRFTSLSMKHNDFRFLFCSRTLFTVMILLYFHVQLHVQGSISTSKSQLKHERNGRCKWLN